MSGDVTERLRDLAAKFPFRKPGQTPSLKMLMADAITGVLTADGKQFYDELSDDELLDWGTVLWDYYGDLREEWTRREMQRAAEKRA